MVMKISIEEDEFIHASATARRQEQRHFILTHVLFGFADILNQTIYQILD